MRFTRQSIVRSVFAAFALWNSVSYGHSIRCPQTSTPVSPDEASVITSVSGEGGIVNVGGSATRFTEEGKEDYYAFNLSLDSASDVLLIDASISDVVGTLFNNFELNDVSPGFQPCSWNGLWISTPGGTSAVDSSRLTAGETVTHFDTTDEGAQTGFHWAAVPLIPNEAGFASATLNARFQTAAQPTPVYDDVIVVMTVGTVPEPTANGLAIVALLGGLGFFRRRRIIPQAPSR